VEEATTTWQIEYYTDARGGCPVRDYTDALPEPEQAQVARKLQLLKEFGIASHMTGAKSLKGHKPLWELRPGAHRIIYFTHTGRRIILLHAFRKQWNRTRIGHIETAERRMARFLEREGR
jgi:phage-related protein